MMRSILFIVLLYGMVAHAEVKRTICLNMIVKDEKLVIERCLASVKGLIDYWVIVDTGSSDGTQAVIREFMKDLPGELHERPWVNFEHNRNEALQLAKNRGDYLLFIDADEQLFFSEHFVKPALDKDYYYIPVRQDCSDCLRTFLINSRLPWHWQGVIHEDLICPEAQSCDVLAHVVNSAEAKDGHRAKDPLQSLKDAAILEKALETEPNNTRYVIFLGQCYMAAKDYDRALKAYEKRLTMPGWDQEIFLALYNIGKIHELRGDDFTTVVNSYCKAYQFRPTRAEPLFRLACYCYSTNNYLLGYLTAKFAQSIPQPQDIVHVEPAVYNYALSFVLAGCAYGLGQYEEAATLYEEILTKPHLPNLAKEETERNLSIARSSIKELLSRAPSR